MGVVNTEANCEVHSLFKGANSPEPLCDCFYSSMQAQDC